MLIAITADGPDGSAGVDPRFGRAHGFVLAETETGELRAVDNRQNLQAAQGAGIQSARRVAECGARAVLTGHMGPKAFATCQAAGIEVYTGVTGTVAEALARFQAGRLSPAETADVESHWAPGAGG